MKIYKLDIDTSKPINQTLAMQQNSAGMLSIDVTNNGKYIRNLSCEVYDGDTEIAESKYGYKVGVDTEPKHVKIVAKSVPINSIKQGVASTSGANRQKRVWLVKLTVKPGVYNQDEFLPVLNQIPNNDGLVTIWELNVDSLSGANFNSVAFQKMHNASSIRFRDINGYLPVDAPIIVTSEISAGSDVTITKMNYTLSTDEYPAVGYWTDYQMDTLIRPSENAAAYANIEYDPSNIDAGSISADSVATDSITLSGVTYVPTTLSVDGVEYTVLARPVEEPPAEEPPAEEPTEE